MKLKKRKMKLIKQKIKIN